MTAAVSEVSKKSYKYLDKFIALLSEGKEVLFDKETVPSRKIYKDGERVKKILSVFDDLVHSGIVVYDKDIIEDIFGEEDFAGKRTNVKWRSIEYQSISDPKKIEVLPISRIIKANISDASRKNTNFKGKESDWSETLTCFALAYRQDQRKDITESGFQEFLIRGRNEDTEVNTIINQNVVTEVDPKLVYQYGLEKPDWIKSCANTANALYKSSYGLKASISYNFYHAGAKEIEWFKSKFKRKFNQVLANALRQEGYASGDTGEDKWNPADMFAIKKQTTEQKVEKEITTKGFFNSGTLKDYEKFKKGKKGILATGEKLQEDMAELTRYNNWIHENILSGEFIPISLKKTLNTARVDLISNPSIEQYEIDVSNIKVSWEPTAQKIYIYFDVTYTFIVGDKKKSNKKTISYFFDCRNFGVGTGVQFELGINGSSAKHGKVAAGPTEMIIDLSGPVVSQLMKKTRENYIKFMRTPNVRTKMFPNLTAPIPEASLKSFENTIGKKSRPEFFTNNVDINTIVNTAGWPSLLGNYVIYLSKEQSHDLKKSENDLKNYFKSKIAATELGWIMSSSKIMPVIKNNILKSLYLYASSQGLQIFGDSGLLKTSYFYNSSYIKVRD